MKGDMLGPGPVYCCQTSNRGPGVWCLCFALQQLSPCHPATFHCFFLFSFLFPSFYFLICPTMSVEYDALLEAYTVECSVSG